MKKFKLLTSFVGLTTLMGVTTILTTSCSNGELKDIIINVNSKEKASGTKFEESDIEVKAIYANNKEEVIKYDETGNNGYAMSDDSKLIKIGHDFVEDEIDQTKDFKIIYKSKVQTGSIKVVKGSQPGPVVGDTFKVEFDVNGGDFLEAQIVKKGEYATKVTPTKKDCTFINWFTDKECTEGKEYNFETTPVTANIVLYAKWKTAIVQNGIEFNILSEEDATCEVKWDYKTTLPAEFEIPSTYTNETTNKTYTVTRIANSAFYDSDNYIRNYDIKRVIIPSTVKTIGCGAFLNTGKLKSVEFPEGLEIIEDAAFCFSGLSGELILPESLLDIGSVKDPSINYDGAFYGTNITKVVIPSKVKTITYDCFASTRNLKEVVFNNVEKISGSAFCSSGIETIELPNSLTEIGESAFASSSIETVELPNSLTEIGEYAFNACTNLKQINIPSKVTSLYSSNQFAQCSELKKVCFDSPDGWYNSKGEACPFADPEQAAQYLTNEEVVENEYDLHKDTPTEGTGFVFHEIDKNSASVSWDKNTQLTETVTLPSAYNKNGVHRIITDLYYDSENNLGAFENCTATTFVLPSSLQNITKQAFKNCSIKNIKFANNIVSIGANAFTGSQLEKASFDDQINRWQISDSGETLLNPTMSESELASNLKSTYNSYDWNKYETLDKIEFDWDSATTEEPYEINVAGSKENADLETLIIPPTVTKDGITYKVVEINYEAFEGNKFNYIKIPKTIRKFDTYAFSSCTINKIDIPKDSELTTFGSYCFAFVRGLKSIFIPKNVSTISNSFYWSDIERVEIDSESVLDKLDEYVLYGMPNLKYFNVPKNVTEISGYLFGGDAPENLTEIKFDDAAHSWTINVSGSTETWTPDSEDYSKNATKLNESGLWSDSDNKLTRN